MKIFVAGCGTMGSGIIQTFATHGHDVYMYDQEMSFIDRGYGLVEKQLNRQVEKGKMEAAARDEALSRMHKTLDVKDAADCDMVIEAIFELMAAKRDIFEALDEVCREDCLFCSNTSSLSITEMAHGFKHEANFIGFHFFNPAPVMKLIEVIRGAASSDKTVERAFEIARAIDKEPVLVKESPGFIVNRLLIPMINEAAELYDRGIATAEDIDTAMKLGANHPMGPLALADLIGIDICLNVMNVLYNETNDSKYRPALILKNMVRAGKLGRKSGSGFYDYSR